MLPRGGKRNVRSARTYLHRRPVADRESGITNAVLRSGKVEIFGRDRVVVVLHSPQKYLPACLCAIHCLSLILSIGFAPDAMLHLGQTRSFVLGGHINKLFYV